MTSEDSLSAAARQARAASPRPVRPTGLVLASGPRPEVDAWVVSSVVPVAVVPQERWTAVVATGESRAEAPYDDGALVLASRALPAKAAPGIGFFEIDGRAVVTVHLPGRRREVRWVVWQPDTGLTRPPGLPLAGPAEVVRAAAADPQARDELVELLHETGVRPARMLQAVMATLGLPFARLVERPSRVDQLEGARRHTPDPRQVGWFDDAVRDSVQLRHELGVTP